MRWLIDGYNVMHAGGLMGKRFTPEGGHKARSRFLANIAEALGPVEAYLTTVVFDSSKGVPDRPNIQRISGIEVIFAVEDESADIRIDELISKHTSPKTLTVVSSDNQVRASASKRRAKQLSADQFWVEMDRRKEALSSKKPVPDERPPRRTNLSEAEAAYWETQFADVAKMPETKTALNQVSSLLSDEEIRQLEREIAEED